MLTATHDSTIWNYTYDNTPSTGRFLTRDTWSGNANRPLSLNRWGYVEGNPINLTDPSGKCVFWPPSWNAGKVESKIYHLSKLNWLNTYTAAGLAMQCWGEGIDGTPENPFPRKIERDEKGWPKIVEHNDSWGPAQVSYEQTLKPYGTDDNLRCYVLKNAPNAVRICLTLNQLKDDCLFSDHLVLEPPLDPHSWRDAAILMGRRIQQAINATCNDMDCKNTDRYIIAAMAQNGPGFLGFASNYEKREYKLPTNNITSHVFDWEKYYKKAKKIDTSEQLSRFTEAIQGFRAKDWYIPKDINVEYINFLIGIKRE